MSPARTRTRSPRRTWLAGTTCDRAIGADPLGRGRGELQQGPDRSPGVVQAQRLQCFGQPIQEGHRRGLVPLSQGHRTQDRQPHEHVDIETQPRQVPRRPGKDPDSPDDHGQRIARPCQAKRRGLLPDPSPAPAMRTPSPRPAPARSRRSGPSARAATTTREPFARHHPRRVACSPVRSAISRTMASGSTTLVVIVHRHRPVDQVEAQAGDPGLIAQGRA